jgi:hypothetical protein
MASSKIDDKKNNDADRNNIIVAKTTKQNKQTKKYDRFFMG